MAMIIGVMKPHMDDVTFSISIWIENLETYTLPESPHLLVWITSEWRVSTLVATNGSHWLK
jgi:hypothetical protein